MSDDPRSRDQRAADVRRETGASWRDIATLGQYVSPAEARAAVERVAAEEAS